MKQREEIFMDVIVVDNVSDNFIMRRIHGFICNCIKTSLIVNGFRSSRRSGGQMALCQGRI